MELVTTENLDKWHNTCDHQEVDVDNWDMYGYNYGGPIIHDHYCLNIVELPETLEHLSPDFRELYITELGNRCISTFDDALLLLENLMMIYNYRLFPLSFLPLFLLLSSFFLFIMLWYNTYLIIINDG